MATVYLSPTGSDSYTYAQAQNISTPWLTPNKVQSSATTGDTVSVANGTYTIGTSSTFTKSFTWVAATNGSVVFDAAHVIYSWGFQAAQTFTGIKFYRWKHNASLGVIFFISSTNSITNTYNDCVFDNIKVYAFVANTGGVLGSNNSNGANYTLNRCVFTNVIYETTQAGSCLFAFRNADATSGVQLNNCTIYLPSTTATIEKILNDGGSSGKPVVSGKNNIFESASAITWGATGSTMTYSCGHNITSFPANTGNITSDPLFVDAASGNYNLRPTSPCIDTGTLV